MTEAEWLTAVEPMPMFEYLRGKGSDRKFRLFGVACCRRIWDRMTHEQSRMATSVAEAFADGLHTRSELLTSWAAAEVLTDPWQSEQEAQRNPVWYETKKETHPGYLAACVSDPDTQHAGAYEIIRLSQGEASWHLCAFLRDIFGNPFRPIVLDPKWLSPSVISLATGIYQDRTFDLLPVLANALQDADCDNKDLLNHLRGDGQHCLGCWALDLVLGKS